MKNGDETDVDCGGEDCQACGVAQQCAVDGDCADDDCYEGSCDPFCGGSGTDDDPWLICSPLALQQLLDSETYLEDSFLVTEDLDLAELGPGAFDSTAPLQPWALNGVFDGGHKTISNLDVSDQGWVGRGLFNEIGFNGELRNITLTDSEIVAEGKVGLLAGQNDGVIENCHVAGQVSATGSVSLENGDSVGVLVGSNGSQAEIVDSSSSGRAAAVDGRVGGLVGQNRGTIRRSFSSAAVDVTGTTEAGGLVGRHYQPGTIETCFATGEVAGTAQIGGFVGRHQAHSSIENSYATGDVSAQYGSVGGFAGYLAGALSKSYSTGAITSPEADGGGFVGVDDRANTSSNFVEYNYWNTETSGRDSSPVGEGLDSAEFADEDSFHEDWRFEPVTDFVWVMPPGGPPQLFWQ